MNQDLPRLHNLLAQFYNRQKADLFLRSPQSLLNGEIPNDLIAKGRTKEVIRVVQKFLDGTYL